MNRSREERFSFRKLEMTLQSNCYQDPGYKIDKQNIQLGRNASISDVENAEADTQSGQISLKIGSLR
jgi:hypothetical protein